MATFDLQHFFETRQELASRTGSLYAQRSLAGIRESLRTQQAESREEQPKTGKKPVKKANETESEESK